MEREAFAVEAEAAWSGTTAAMDRILSSGYSDAAVRPGPYHVDRVPPPKLEPFVLENTVRLRGWPVPFVDNRTRVDRHASWIGQDIEPLVVPHCEAWRACTSGQFLHRRVLATDLRESRQLEPNAAGATGAVAVWDVLLYVVELAELGARIAIDLECETVTIAVSLNGIGGRQLISGDWQRELHADYIVSDSSLSASETVRSAGLIEDPRPVGVRITQRLLGKFGLDISDQVLLDWQDQILGN